MKPGKKHALLTYTRTMERLWGGTLVLGLLLFALWYFGPALTRYYRPGYDPILLVGAVYTTTIGLFAFVARRMAYVRAFEGYLLVASPFFRFRTSYQRVLAVRSSEFHRLFDLEDLSWTEERYVESLIGTTAVVVKLSDYPLAPGVIELFFRKYLLLQNETAFALLVDDWMGFSVELDSRFNRYQQARGLRRRKQGFQRGITS